MSYIDMVYLGLLLVAFLGFGGSARLLLPQAAQKSPHQTGKQKI